MRTTRLKNKNYWTDTEESLVKNYYESNDRDRTRIYNLLMPKLERMASMIFMRYFSHQRFDNKRKNDIIKDSCNDLIISLMQGKYDSSSRAYAWCGTVLKHNIYDYFGINSRYKSGYYNYEGNEELLEIEGVAVAIPKTENIDTLREEVKDYINNILIKPHNETDKRIISAAYKFVSDTGNTLITINYLNYVIQEVPDLKPTKVFARLKALKLFSGSDNLYTYKRYQKYNDSDNKLSGLSLTIDYENNFVTFHKISNYERQRKRFQNKTGINLDDYQF
jgi:hypothetical protein